MRPHCSVTPQKWLVALHVYQNFFLLQAAKLVWIYAKTQFLFSKMLHFIVSFSKKNIACLLTNLQNVI